MWEKVEKEYWVGKIEKGEYLRLGGVDGVIKENVWICGMKGEDEDKG